MPLLPCPTTGQVRHSRCLPGRRGPVESDFASSANLAWSAVRRITPQRRTNQVYFALLAMPNVPNVTCSLCQSPSLRLLFTKTRFRFWECLDCGHIRVFPYPTQEETAAHYGDGFTEDYLRDQTAWFEVLAGRRLRIIDDLVPARGRCLLDVGCGYGFFLGAAKSKGWHTVGIEGSPVESDYASRTFAVEVIQSDAGSALAQIPDGRFDVVTFWHALEHLEQPDRILVEALRVLREGGLLVVNSPNMDSAAFRLLKKRWSWIHCPGHVQYFKLPVLEDRLLRQGMRIMKKETWTDAPNLFFLIEEAGILLVSSILSRIGLRKAASPFRSFALGSFNHRHVQRQIRRFYGWTPWLDSYLVRRSLGHEFLLIAQKADGSRDGAPILG
jgi:SAM-dependent methyltransferase